MEQISITRLTETDIYTLIPLANRIWNEHYPGIITKEQIDYMLERSYSKRVIQDEMNNHGIIWLVIWAGKTMIGFASLGPYSSNTMKLHKLYLLPDYHGKGIGAHVLAEVEQIAKDNAAVSLVLNVNKHNTKAIKAYKRSGWHITDMVVADIGNGFVMDDFVMLKNLE